MMKLVVVCTYVVLVTVIAAKSMDGVTDCNSYEVEIMNDGYHKCVNHSTGTPVIGVGFNLTADGAQKEIEAVGADYGKVLDGKECLNDTQIKKLFNVTMDTAIKCASTFADNYSTIGKGPQSTLADMAFNIGCYLFHTYFTILRIAVEENDFAGAADVIKGYQWCEWVGKTRCDRDMSCMTSGN